MSIKTILLATVTVFAVSPVMAADLVVEEVEVEPAAASYDWNGVYIGVGAGMVSGSVDQMWDVSDIWTGAAPPPYELSNSPSGWALSAYAGFNYVVGDGFVVGLEGEYVATDATEDNGGPWYPASDHHVTNITSLWSVSGKAGVAADAILFYATAGVAGGNVEISSQCDAACASTDTATASGHQIGWTVGAGLDFMVADNVTVGVNYKYIDLGSAEYTPNVLPGNWVSSERTVTTTANVLSARVGFKF